MTQTPPLAGTQPDAVVTAGDGGHFLVMGKVNGERVRFLVEAAEL